MQSQAAQGTHLICDGVLVLLLDGEQPQYEAGLLLHLLPTA